MANQEGTGKHGHKDSHEPYSHHEGQSHSGGSHHASGDSHGKGSGSHDESLKSREYRDEQGNIHHHTKSYEEEHHGKDR